MPDPVKSVLLPAEMRVALLPKVFQAIEVRLADGRVPFGVLAESVGEEMEQPQHLVARHIMWLMKYGRIEPVFHENTCWDGSCSRRERGRKVATKP